MSSITAAAGAPNEQAPMVPAKPPLRVGLLVDSELRRFQAEIVRQINASSFARLELVVDNRAAAAAVADEASRRRPVLFTMYERWDSARFDQRDNPLNPVDAAQLLNTLPTITLPAGGLDEAAIADIKSRRLDILLYLGANRPVGGPADVATFGTWSLDPPVFADVYEGRPVTGIALRAHADDPALTLTLASGFYSTRRGSWSLNARQPYWGAVTLVLQKLRELQERGWDRLKASAPNQEASPPKDEIPSNRQLARWWIPQVIAERTNRFKTPMERHWRIATRLGRSPALPEAAALDLDGFTVHESPRGHFYADPFLIREGERDWVFFEDYSYASRRGVIGCAEVLADGSLGAAQTILERPYHLSYPCLLRDRGELYMVPESLDNKTIDIFRCVQFPARWEFVKVLLFCRAVDSTVFNHDGFYWLFTSILEPHAHARQLFLFYARDLFGEWIPHPANPLSSDIRVNRGAGAVVASNERLIRPSQDCGRSYGYSFSLNEIVTLTTSDYAERTIVTVHPMWTPGGTGTHTYARNGWVEAVDVAARLPTAMVAPPELG